MTSLSVMFPLATWFGVLELVMCREAFPEKGYLRLTDAERAELRQITTGYLRELLTELDPSSVALPSTAGTKETPGKPRGHGGYL